MAGMCPQYPVYWCPLQDSCPGVPKKAETGEIRAPSMIFEQASEQKKVPYCIIAHNAASSAVVACARIGIPPPKMAVDFLKTEASSLWGMTGPNSG